MPSSSSAQHRLMEAALHDPEVRERTGISRQTAQDFVNADKRSKDWKKREHVPASAKALGASAYIADLLNRA